MGKGKDELPPPGPGPIRRATRAVALLVVAALLLAPVVTAIAVILTGMSDSRRVSDVIIVLGAAQDDGRPRDVLQARLDHAEDLYEAGVAPRIVTVGGKAPGDRFTEAAAGRTALIAAGVPAGDVIAVGEGRDTLTSLEAAAEVMESEGWCTAVIVSDPWHVLRSRTMARDLGMDAVASPTTSGPTQNGSFALRYIVRETAAQLYFLTAQARDVDPVVTGCG